MQLLFIVYKRLKTVFWFAKRSKTSFQVLLESKPQSNPYRIKMKPQATDQAVLTTLQNVPGVGQKKAVALLSKFNSRYFLAS